MLVFTHLPALILAVACLAIAAPSSSGVVVPAGADISEAIATHPPTPISTIDEKGGSVEPDSTTCYELGDPCHTNSDCCAGQICRFVSSLGVSAMLITENLMIDFAFLRAFVIGRILGRVIHPPRKQRQTCMRRCDHPPVCRDI